MSVLTGTRNRVEAFKEHIERVVGEISLNGCDVDGLYDFYDGNMFQAANDYTRTQLLEEGVPDHFVLVVSAMLEENPRK